jgi:hypothetical protein
LTMSWTLGGRELVFRGRLPLEQSVALEQAIWNIAKSNRAEDKKIGPTLPWTQYAADALVTLATRTGSGEDSARRSPVTVIVHLSADAPPMLEGAGAISLETAERLCCDARRLTLQPRGDDLVHSRIGRCASYPQMRALDKRADGHCQYPGCTIKHELRAHHLVHDSRGGKAVLENMILLCSRHHDLVHDHHIRTTGTGEHPVFTDPSGRTITANQPHAPPR